MDDAIWTHLSESDIFSDISCFSNSTIEQHQNCVRLALENSDSGVSTDLGASSPSASGNNSSTIRSLQQLLRSGEYSVSLCVAVLSLCVCGIVGNSLMVSVLAVKTMRTPFNFIMSAVAVVDTVGLVDRMVYTAALELQPLLTKEARSPTLSSAHWMSYKIFHVNFSTMYSTMSIYLLLALSVARYISVHRREHHTNWLNSRRSQVLTAVIIVATVAIFVPNYFTQRQVFVKTNNRGSNSTSSRSSVVNVLQHKVDDSEYTQFRTWFYIIGVKILPSIALIVFTVLIIVDLKKVKAKQAELFAPRSVDHRQISNEESVSGQLEYQAVCSSVQPGQDTLETHSKDNIELSHETVPILTSQPTDNQNSDQVQDTSLNNYTPNRIAAKVKADSKGDDTPPVQTQRPANIFKRLMTSTVRRKKPPSPTNMGYTRTNRLLVTAVICNLVLELPQGICRTVAALDDHYARNGYKSLKVPFIILSIISDLANFTIYVSMSQKFRDNFKRMYVSAKIFLSTGSNGTGSTMDQS